MRVYKARRGVHGNPQNTRAPPRHLRLRLPSAIVSIGMSCTDMVQSRRLSGWPSGVRGVSTAHCTTAIAPLASGSMPRITCREGRGAHANAS